MKIPLSFMVVFISENVRITRGSAKFSATVTTERNQVGKFSDEYRYVVDKFYEYAKKYQTFSPKKLPLKYEDIFLHLHQNVTEQVEVSHTHCVISIVFVLQSHKSVDQLNSHLARCLATNHLMTRRYPKQWNVYYILLGLREYYAKFMRLSGGGREADDDFAGIGINQIMSFHTDDSDEEQPLLGGAYADTGAYLRLNNLRGGY